MPGWYVFMNESDSILSSKAKSGDRKAYEKLVKKYDRIIFNLALRMTSNYEDAMDITQETFIKAYENIESFRSSFKFFSWLYRIAVNTSLNYVQKLKGRNSVSLNDSAEINSRSESTPENDYIRAEREKKVQEALMSLDEQSRAILILKYFVELSYREISEVSGIPEKLVKSRLYSARQEIKTLLIK